MTQGDPVQSGGRCPSCERFIGPASICPYCDADAVPVPGLRFLRVTAMLLALAGTALLLVAGRHRDLPRIYVADITSSMNFAAVRVSGRVSRAPYVKREDGVITYASFLLDDGSGVIRVQLRQPLVAALAHNDELPSAGARLNVSGRLDVRAHGEARLAARRLHPVDLARAPGDPP